MQRVRSEINSLAATVLRGASEEDRVLLAWPLVCGAHIAERSKAVAFQDGTLFVEVPDRSYQAELAGYLPHYLNQISAASQQQVSSIRFVLTGHRIP